MFERWRTESSVEEIDLTNTSVAELPDVKTAQQEYAEAVAAYQALEAETRRLTGILSPYVTKDRQVDPIERAHAEAAWPDVKRRLALAEAAKIQTGRDLNRVMDAARQRIAQARIPGRKSLVRELFERLDPCVKVAEQLSRYDEETERLCASRPEAPFPELLVGWTTGENAVSYRRRHFCDWLD